MTALLLFLACQGPTAGTPAASDDTGWHCMLDPADPPPYATDLGCGDDFDLLASAPLDASIPGSTSVKTVLDRADDDAFYFQDSDRYPLHWDFAQAWLSGDGLPLVPDLSTFNATEYSSPDRRFVLGALSWYQEPDVRAFELSPYDSASAELIELAWRTLATHSWLGEGIAFHPTSTALEAQAALLPPDIPVISTDELFAGISYQPLNPGSSMGQLAFYEVDGLDEALPGTQEIVVLDGIPADISVVSGIITAEFQTPLSHLNVLSQNRGTPNMALRGGWEDETLRSLEGQWVELTVGSSDWSIREVTAEEALAWWEEHKPDPIEIQPMDTSVSDLLLEEEILGLGEGALDGEGLDGDLAGALAAAVPVVGGKAAHYGALARIGPAVPHPEAFAVPVSWYDHHMSEHGLWDQVEAMLADPEFAEDRSVREVQLELLRDAIQAAPVDPELVALVQEQITTGYSAGLYPSTRFRFRSSTNAEDLSGFNGAGLYESKTGDPLDDSDPVDEAIAEVWASTWSLAAFEEREYFGIDHRQVGMALLCHRSFPDEEANGVAVTGNIFDPSGLEPAFTVNVQEGEASVVDPEPGVVSDQLLVWYTQPGQPVSYLAHSSLLPEGETVLADDQVEALSDSLEAVHDAFQPVYGDAGFYAMDVEFKVDLLAGDSEPTVLLKQARPYPDQGSD